MFCPKCGNELVDTAKFCPKCGEALGSRVAPPAAKQQGAGLSEDQQVETLAAPAGEPLSPEPPVSETAAPAAPATTAASAAAASTTPSTTAAPASAAAAKAATSSASASTKASSASAASGTGAATAAASGGGNLAKYAIIAVVAVLVVVVLSQVLGGGCAANNAGSGTAAGTQQAAKHEAPQPKNLEEWLAVNDPDWVQRYRNSLMNDKAIAGLYDISIAVSGNQVSVVEYLNQGSGDAGLLGNLAGTFINDLLDAGTEGSWMAGWSDTVKQWEQASGFSGLRLHLELRYKDGGLMNSYDFSSSGRIN